MPFPERVTKGMEEKWESVIVMAAFSLFVTTIRIPLSLLSQFVCMVFANVLGTPVPTTNFLIINSFYIRTLPCVQKESNLVECVLKNYSLSFLPTTEGRC